MGPSHQGLPIYYPVLVHRFKEQALRMTDLQAAGSHPHNHAALWNFLQQYMDTSAPLPDIPLFEPNRAKDPTTAAYDQHTGRNPRYWIDMDEATYEQKTKDMHQACLRHFK